MLKLNHITKHYQDFTLDCSLEVNPWFVTGLVGPNGAGKSTTFKAALGLIHTDAGSIEWFGQKVSAPGPAMKQEIGVVLSESGFSEYLTVRDIVPILQSLYPRFQKEAFLKNCDRFRIPPDKKIQSFSTGMKVRLKVLTAMSYQARILLLDEPTAGLDVLARQDLTDMLREYMEGEDRSILISSHISSDLEGLCDDIYLISGGRTILHEDTDILLGKYGVLKVSDDQFASLDRQYILRTVKEPYGYRCLTDEKQFYVENYPKIIVENGSIDDTIMLMVKGDVLK